MSKTTPKRRLNKKARRSIRRTMAVVLLITSLVVAAIPVPEAAAEDGTSSTTSSTLTYPDSFSDFTISHSLISSMEPNGIEEKKALTVRKMSDGTWQLDWQFKFFSTPGEHGVISEYNSTYKSDEVTLNPNVTMGYQVVELTEYDAFYESVADLLYEITYDEYISVTSSQSAVAFFTKFFPDTYEAYKEVWDQFKIDMDYWNSLTPEEQLNRNQPVLEAGWQVLSMGPKDLNENQKFLYYCDENGYPGATLVKVFDYREGVTTPSKIVYMPNGGDGETKDVNGFWYDDAQTASIIAIGDKAFKGTKNVYILHLPGEIKYIGQEAFQDSFIQEVTFDNVETIGHRAFKDCSQLRTVELSHGATILGNEAFYNTGITSISFPYSIDTIGAGAFAECRNLQEVNLSEISQPNCAIGDFGFYNDTALNTIVFDGSTINSIGKGTFAVSSGVVGTLDTFVFPATISKESQFGDYMFAGRTNMKHVTMPRDFGKAESVTVPAHTFEGCINLECVEFPADGGGSCGYTKFSTDIFKNVINQNFYVRGPELDREGVEAMPRQCTWGAYTAASEYVPYVYVKDGVDYYEVSKDAYLLLVNSNGELASCVAVEGRTLVPGFELIIPEQVGTITVNSVAQGCFDREPEIKENVGKITIKDGSISRVDDNVFANCPRLTSVYVGNSVKSIGNNAFINCPKLTDITFATPMDGNYSGFTIGTNALTTGSDRLTVHADIVDGYAPFEWAMNPNNYVDEISGTRVCYRGLAPKYMTAIVDNNTNMPTLVDYPKYDRIDMENQDYIEELAFYYVSKYGTQNQNGDSARAEATVTELAEGNLTAVEGDTLYASVDDTLLASSVSDGGTTDDSPTTPTYDCPDPREYHIDDWKDYAAKYSIIDKYEAYVVRGEAASYEWQTMTPKELEIINATKHLVVPSGITSIDAYGFFNDANGSNANNINKYFSKTDNNYKMCTPGSGNIQDEVQPGIFSGYYKDYDTVEQSEDAALYEKLVKGNDRVETITLTAVEFLPDYAFDSCERLHTVVLGDACTDIGIAPFRGCTNLVNVGGNEHYTSENGIIYSKKADGTLQIEECLSARGSTGLNSIGTKYVNATTDPLLANVSSIAEGAFQNCDYISKVDFTVMEKIKTIPKACFNDCDTLSDVILPTTVNEIQEEAFSDTPTGLSVTIPGIEVSIEDTAFDHSEGTIRTYENSAAYIYARYHNIDIELLSEKHRVTFLDYDGTELDVQLVDDGGTAIEPEVPKRKGYTFTGWSEDFKSVTKDLWVVAQYKVDGSNGNGGSTGGNTGGSNNGGSSSSSGSTTGGSSAETSGVHNVTVINGTGSGTYKKGQTVTITANGPATGQKFDKWITNSLNVAMTNVTSSQTTFTMPDNSVVITATFKSTSITSTGNSGTTNGTTSSGNTIASTTVNNNGTTVRVNKPGISNTGLASAVVRGSSDKFMVVISDSAEATAAVEAALKGQYGERFDALRYVAMDISLYDATGTAKIENTQGLSVDITIPIPDALIQYGGNNKAISVTNGALEHLGTKFTAIGGVPCMTFTATHFSPYGVYVDTQNLTASMDMTPKTGDGIHPKWFLAVGLLCASVVLFMKKDEKKRVRTA